mgnify:CR=1 FL=1
MSLLGTTALAIKQLRAKRVLTKSDKLKISKEESHNILELGSESELNRNSFRKRARRLVYFKDVNKLYLVVYFNDGFWLFESTKQGT